MKAIFLDDFSFALVQSQVYLRGLVRGSMYKLFAHKLPPLDKLLILTILHIKILGNEIANQLAKEGTTRNKPIPTPRIHTTHIISCWLNGTLTCKHHIGIHNL